MPLEYFGMKTGNYSASSGADMLGMSGQTIRPRIGGRVTRKQLRRRRSQKTRKTQGGFIPSVMEGFAVAAHKYIVPLALFAGYKMVSKDTPMRHSTKLRRTFRK